MLLICLKIAEVVIKKQSGDPTEGATLFYDSSKSKTAPKWVEKGVKTVTISSTKGVLEFYKMPSVKAF